jgi:hypothetical protein
LRFNIQSINKYFQLCWLQTKLQKFLALQTNFSKFDEPVKNSKSYQKLNYNSFNALSLRRFYLKIIVLIKIKNIYAINSSIIGVSAKN